MPGAVFGTILVAGLVIVLAFGLSTLFLIPVVLLALAALVAIPMFGAMREARLTAADTTTTGVPTTRDASYDAQVRPH
ncbi:MAG: hypothetical protein HZB46_11040 [Solirubrobacterales bacterium]|nr:hypothetical protein [Solirubrobacterales bacterium]